MLSKLLFAASAALLLAGTARADYIWLQSNAAGYRVQAGMLHKPLVSLPALQQVKALLADGRTLTTTTQAGQFTVPVADVPVGGDVRFTATWVTPAAGDKEVLTYHQARFGRAETRAVNEFELVPDEANGNSFRLMFKGRPVAASQINVDTAQGWRRVLTPAKDGTFTLETPIPGLYVLEVSARVDNGAVTLNGKRYDDVRHTATLSFEVKN